METKHKELLEDHRTQFVESVEVERLFPLLSGSVLSADDIGAISSETSPGTRADKLLDVVKTKRPDAFGPLCEALQSTYPHLLTRMILGGESGDSEASQSADSGKQAPQQE